MIRYTTIQGLNPGVEQAIWPTLEEIETAKVRIQYKKENLHFAITGASHSGKTSLINALRHMKNSNQKAAKTGVGETTLELGRYPDPDRNPPRSKFVWYDVPDVRTSSAPARQYMPLTSS
jgi:GTPase SAR1 family protein